MERAHHPRSAAGGVLHAGAARHCSCLARGRGRRGVVPVGALDDAALRDGVNVGFLLYVGVILSFAGVFAHVGLDDWLVQSLTGLSGVIAGRPIVCLLLVAGMAAVISITLRPSPIVLLIAAALVPTATSAGVHPWVVMFTAMLANNLWLYPQQNVL